MPALRPPAGAAPAARAALLRSIDDQCYNLHYPRSSAVVLVVNAYMLKSKAFYWFVVIASTCLLLWGWAVALKNILRGTTVDTG